MERITCKFGGTSLATAEQFQKIKSIVLANPKRKIVVVSAPGKKNSKDIKITDLLYGCYEMAQKGLAIDGIWIKIEERFLEIEKDLGLDCGMAGALSKVKAAIQGGEGKDYVASRGEYLNAVLVARFLGAIFIDAAESIFFDSRGRIDPRTYQILGQKMHDPSRLYVLPGFYGLDVKGHVKTFSRGGSDISGAIAARAAMSVAYENWTDVSGLLMADPSIVENAKPMDYVSYREIRELSYMGAKVFHNEAIEPVRERGIPIHIKNTNRPNDPGTQIVPEIPEDDSLIAGIAGIKDVVLFNIEKYMMNKEKGFGRRVLGIFEALGVNFEHAPTGIDSMSVLVQKEEIGEKIEEIESSIREALAPDNITVSEDLSLIATVGEGMSQRVGIAATLFTALSKAGVNVRVIDQGSSEVNIIVGVARSDYENAIRALYNAFVNTSK